MVLKTLKTVAFLDIGTNSARLLVVRLNANGSYTILTELKEMIRLGEGGFGENRLLPDAMMRTETVITRLIELAATYKYDEIIAVATSATRDAENGEELIDRIHLCTGVLINVISGTEEARLIWLGVSDKIDIGHKKALFIDIGGGSTEVIVGDQYEPYILRSLKLGAIRTTNAFIPADFTSPIPTQVIDDIRRHIDSRITHTLRHIREFEIQEAYGSSGTILTLESIAQSLKSTADTHQSRILKTSELETVIRHLWSLNLEERKALPGLNPERADIIISGALILSEILKGSHLDAIKTTSASLRDGLLVDYISKIPGFPYAEQVPIRIKTIQQLGRSCHINEAHALHIASLALQLFDSGYKISLHLYNEEARELLAHAAYLHDVGQFISFSGHHQHSFYVITHVPLLGFNQHEVLLIGLIARYHRKKIPRTKDPGFANLENADRRLVRMLAQFLRIAEDLDRSHEGRVVSASFSSIDPENIGLSITCVGDCSLEQWAVADDEKFFFKTFKRGLKVQMIDKES